MARKGTLTGIWHWPGAEEDDMEWTCVFEGMGSLDWKADGSFWWDPSGELDWDDEPDDHERVWP
jgi:hypothetical protein